MEMRGIFGGFFLACEWIMRLVYLNILWVGFTLIGLVIFGFFPATITVFSITRKWIQGDTEGKLFQEFWDVYKKEFVKSNLFGLVLSILAGIIAFDLYFFYHLDGMLNQILFYVFIALAFNFAVMLLYIFPVYVHYDLKLFQNIKYALVIGMSNPFHTFSMIICLVFIYFLLDIAPASFLFFSVAPLCLILMLISHRIFVNIENKNKTIED